MLSILVSSTLITLSSYIYYTLRKTCFYKYKCKYKHTGVSLRVLLIRNTLVISIWPKILTTIVLIISIDGLKSYTYNEYK